MKIKEGASLQGLQIQMRTVLISAEIIWKELGQELVVTSGTDGEHRAGSLHYYGFAVDLRTRYFTNKERQIAFNRLASTLHNKPYIVVLEETHIHVQYDGELYGRS